MNPSSHALESASSRLVASRARLRAEMLVAPAELGADRRLALDLLQVAAGVEGAEPAAGAWRWVCAVVDQGLGDPIRRHPWAALGLGLGAGALVAVARPWRWHLPGPLLVALASQLLLPLLARPRDGRP